MEKIYGEYTTYDKEEISKLPEEDIYKKIEHWGGVLFWYFHDMNKPWHRDVPNEKIEEIQYNIEYLVYETKRFGVEFSREPKAGEHVERSESYNKWYRFWDEYFRGLDEATMNKICDAKQKGEDVSEYLPKTKWNEGPARQ